VTGLASPNVAAEPSGAAFVADGAPSRPAAALFQYAGTVRSDVAAGARHRSRIAHLGLRQVGARIRIDQQSDPATL
jgi:hypothetical protein